MSDIDRKSFACRPSMLHATFVKQTHFTVCCPLEALKLNLISLLKWSKVLFPFGLLNTLSPILSTFFGDSGSATKSMFDKLKLTVGEWKTNCCQHG